MKKLDLHKLLKNLEWSSFQEGQGDGFMSSGPGPWVRACPICRQIDPADHNRGHFNDHAIGHTRHCQLAKAIRETNT